MTVAVSGEGYFTSELVSFSGTRAKQVIITRLSSTVVHENEHLCACICITHVCVHYHLSAVCVCVCVCVCLTRFSNSAQQVSLVWSPLRRRFTRSLLRCLLPGPH